jgi:hypothetical protein
MKIIFPLPAGERVGVREFSDAKGKINFAGVQKDFLSEEGLFKESMFLCPGYSRLIVDRAAYRECTYARSGGGCSQ